MGTLWCGRGRKKQEFSLQISDRKAKASLLFILARTLRANGMGALSKPVAELLEPIQEDRQDTLSLCIGRPNTFYGAASLGGFGRKE